MSFQVITDFEKEVAKFFGAPHAVAVDCCTHGLELCLRHKKANNITVPRHTYLSVPMLADKLSLDLIWTDEKWEDFYYVTEDIIDAAVNWEKDSYIPGTYMCVSFQFRKHLSLGRGGIILFDKKEDFDTLKKMSYDGRSPDESWSVQNIKTIGYHYYMTPETAELGLKKLPEAILRSPKKWVYTDWPDLTKMDIFKDG
ncbi:DegT/DnrJ/EryC1/StrS family aminotransferase [bacterium]|nr:DegT/DnrJ/EryC1/StrS family aminotransferase [bacterium]